MDRASRLEKAERIASMLERLVGGLADKRLLDIGTGSGLIASHLAARGASTSSVDVVDERVVRDVEFKLVASEYLPFPDAEFDIVLSNHVLEHVPRQLLHLKEIRRVLAPGGVCYLATPNKYTLIEPHYRLPLLSWLPDRFADSYLGMTRGLSNYEVLPVSYSQLMSLTISAGFSVVDLTPEVAQHELSRLTHIRLARPPRLLTPLLPTFVLLLSPATTMR